MADPTLAERALEPAASLDDGFPPLGNGHDPGGDGGALAARALLADPGAVALDVLVEPAAPDLGPAAAGPGVGAGRGRRTLVSGTYRGSTRRLEVELRVDIDGPAPTGCVSADYYRRRGATRTYVGSMRVDAAGVTTAATGTITITGSATASFAAAAPVITITIDPVAPGADPVARLEHATLTGQRGDTYVCTWERRAFRQVQLEEDAEAGVDDILTDHDTGSLPSGGRARRLSIASAYAEAGVELRATRPRGVVASSGAGADGTWSDAELHAAMQANLSVWADRAQWAVWLLHAKRHDLGLSLLGIMFDQEGAQRQGAAVFHDAFSGSPTERSRLQLYTCVHELGHSFNLLHSWQKSLADPPGIDDPEALSWMNYPQNYPLGGRAAFWAAFPFTFSPSELVHIRHGFRDLVMQGGSDFATGAALTHLVDGPRPDLVLELLAPRLVSWGAPLSVGLRVRNEGRTAHAVPAHLGPRNGSVDILVERPDGRRLAFEPLLRHCVDEEPVVLLPDAEVVDAAFLQYGAHGQSVDQPGTYRLHARLTTSTGDVVLAQPQTITVLPPASPADAAAGAALQHEQVGTLLSLAGSGADGLAEGRALLGEVVDAYEQHPLARIGAMVLHADEARGFTELAISGALAVTERAPSSGGAERLRLALDTVEPGTAALEGEPGLAPGDDATVAAYVEARRRELELASDPTTPR